MNNKRMFLINTIIFIIIVGNGIGGFYYYNQQVNFITTDDAKITGDIIPVSAKIQGEITDWTAKDGSTVKKGDVLGKVSMKDQLVDITAPQDGTIIQSKVTLGQLTTPGQVLAQIVNLDQLYVTANIEEGDIKDVNTDQQVDVMVDAIPDTKITGKVKEIGTATNSLFSLFPATNTSGDYTKVVQRIPVKIELENAPKDIIPGMNTTVKVHK